MRDGGNCSEEAHHFSPLPAAAAKDGHADWPEKGLQHAVHNSIGCGASSQLDRLSQSHVVPPRLSGARSGSLYKAIPPPLPACGVDNAA